MNKYIYKGGAFDYTASVAHAVLAHFDKWGIWHASPNGRADNWGSLPVSSTELVTANKTITPAENGKTFLFATTAASPVLTLPPASRGKMQFTFSLHLLPTVGTGVKVACAATDKFIGSGLVGTAGQNLGNAVAADVAGDNLEIISNGIDTWHVVRKTGTWTLALA